MAHFEDATNEYSIVHSSEESEVLQKLRRATWLTATKPQMLSDPNQGRFLAMVSKMVQPKKILEFGTFTGYSTLCLSEGLAPEGSIDTLEINDELETIQDTHWEMAGLKNVNRYFGHALETIESGVLQGQYDLIWLDADKEHQIKYVDWAVENLSSGGWLLVDNVIWGGAVLDAAKLAKPNSGASRIDQLNKHIKNHPKLESVLLPVWDGIQVARKL
jgi:predicted O-methyltransferase YrrM